VGVEEPQHEAPHHQLRLRARQERLQGGHEGIEHLGLGLAGLRGPMEQLGEVRAHREPGEVIAEGVVRVDDLTLSEGIGAAALGEVELRERERLHGGSQLAPRLADAAHGRLDLPPLPGVEPRQPLGALVLVNHQRHAGSMVGRHHASSRKAATWERRHPCLPGRPASTPPTAPSARTASSHCPASACGKGPARTPR